MVVIQEAVYKKCNSCGARELVSDEKYGCDLCGRPTRDPNKKYDSRAEDHLRVTVFHNDVEKAEHLEFCSWECVFDYLPKIKTDDFVDLPYLIYRKRDAPAKELRSEGFFEELAKRRKQK